MKDINLISLTQAAKDLSKNSFKTFRNYYGINISDSEIKDLENLIAIIKNNFRDSTLFNHFFVGYTIPQISKEFDLLRFGNNYIINIELKNKKSKSKIEKQLKQNRDYLRFMNKRVFYFSYVSEENLLYQLIDDNLETVSFDILKDALRQQDVNKHENINSLFKPSDYLVSPFNSTDKFLAEQYFLTSHQETIKKNVIKWINTPAGGALYGYQWQCWYGKNSVNL